MGLFFYRSQMSAEKVYHYYHTHYAYDNTNIKYWKYRSVKEFENDGIGICHDVGNYFHHKIANSKRYLMMMKSKTVDDPDYNHTIVTFKRKSETYVIEGTWWMLGGIHGPFTNDIDALRWVNRMYKHIWHGDILNPAPDDLEFEFYEFNDVKYGVNIYEFVEQAKGKRIDLDYHGVIRNVFNNRLVVFICDQDSEALFNFNALIEQCNRNKINNAIYYSDTQIPNNALVVRYENQCLKIGDISIQYEADDLKDPILEKVNDRSYV